MGKKVSADSRWVWVVGAGGLLGSAVCRNLLLTGQVPYSVAVDWTDVGAARETFRAGAHEFLASVGDAPWRIYWCAGSATTTASELELDKELQILRGALAEIALAYEASPSNRLSFFFASSAGALYAGSHGTPFTEETEVQPISRYGESKLAAEQVCHEVLSSVGGSLLIGRIANLYGPGQNLSKPQGLISAFARAELTGEPVRMYVPLDTARDYIYVYDCADAVTRGLDEVTSRQGKPLEATVKIFASEQSFSLEYLIDSMNKALDIEIPITHVKSEAANLQAKELTFKSVVLPQVCPAQWTSLEDGMRSTYNSVKEFLAAASVGKTSRQSDSLV